MTYFATGRLIAKLVPGSKEAERVFLHPDAPITQLAFSNNSGLFYATAAGVGVIGLKPLEFLTAQHTQIRLHKDALYVFFLKTQEILRIGGVSAFLTQ